MRIAITSPSLNVSSNVSGISSIAKTIIDYNKSVSYVHLIAGKPDNDKGAYKTIRVILQSYRRLMKLVTENKFDLLHLNLALNVKSIYRDFVTFRICKFYNRNIMVHLHGGLYLHEKPKSKFTTNLIKYMLKKADRVIALSQLEKSIVENLYEIGGIQVLPNAVDTNFYQVMDSNKDSTKVRFLFFGRLHPSKGLELLIKGFETLCAKAYDIELIICGNGPLKNFVQEKCKENTRITYKGTVSDEAKVKVMNYCDVFALPSLYGEGIPMALLEAMACGLAPIVSTNGSMKNIVTDDTNGKIVKTNDVDDLILKMETLIKDKQLVEKISQNAVKTISVGYDVTNYVDKLNTLYQNIPKGARAGSLAWV